MLLCATTQLLCVPLVFQGEAVSFISQELEPPPQCRLVSVNLGSPQTGFRHSNRGRPVNQSGPAAGRL